MSKVMTSKIILSNDRDDKKNSYENDNQYYNKDTNKTAVVQTKKKRETEIHRLLLWLRMTYQ